MSAQRYPRSRPTLDTHIITFRSSIILVQDKIHTKDPQWRNHTHAKRRAH